MDSATIEPRRRSQAVSSSLRPGPGPRCSGFRSLGAGRGRTTRRPPRRRRRRSPAGAALDPIAGRRDGDDYGVLPLHSSASAPRNQTRARQRRYRGGTPDSSCRSSTHTPTCAPSSTATSSTATSSTTGSSCSSTETESPGPCRVPAVATAANFHVPLAATSIGRLPRSVMRRTIESGRTSSGQTAQQAEHVRGPVERLSRRRGGSTGSGSLLAAGMTNQCRCRRASVGSSSMRSKVSLQTACPFSTMKGTSCARTSSRRA